MARSSEKILGITFVACGLVCFGLFLVSLIADWFAVRGAAGTFRFHFTLFPIDFALAVGALSLGWIMLRRKPRIGHCDRCDYDLTGNVSGICPECGCTVIESASGMRVSNQ